MATLNRVWALATCRGVSAARRSRPARCSLAGEMLRTRSANGGMSQTISSTPDDLERDVGDRHPDRFARLADCGQSGGGAGADVGAQGQCDAAFE